ncbi:MAG: L,D-transpeptidase, partial [Mesorhizobium sp.]
MKTFLFPLFGAAAVLAAGAANANDRYAERPPVVVSPDLSAPWVLQLGHAPGIV